MGRRGFLELVAGVTGGFLKISRVAAFGSQREGRPFTFFVSGVRFQKPVSGLKVGDQVEIRPEYFQGKRCYSVVAAGERKLGYVPRKLIPMLEQTQRLHARLSVVDRFGVPWKRYEVSAHGQVWGAALSLRGRYRTSPLGQGSKIE
jgi:hypothetical protein